MMGILLFTHTRAGLHVSKGESVSRGEVIANVGSTGDQQAPLAF